MARTYPHSHLCHDTLVGFSVKLFGNNPTYFACFNDRDGRRLKRDTNQTRVNSALEAARVLIEQEYAPTQIQAEKVTWEHILQRLTARLATSGNRGSTAGYYLKLVRAVWLGRTRATRCRTWSYSDCTSRPFRPYVLRPGQTHSSHIGFGPPPGLTFK